MRVLTVYTADGEQHHLPVQDGMPIHEVFKFERPVSRVPGPLTYCIRYFPNFSAERPTAEQK